MKRYVYTIRAKEHSEDRVFRVIGATITDALERSKVVYGKIRYKGAALDILCITRGDEVYI